VQIETSPLDCGGCGIVCDADQVCVRGNCRTYYTSPSCNSCPCPACGTGYSCCNYPGAATACVAGATCPM
jgi:hypothetical protein